MSGALEAGAAPAPFNASSLFATDKRPIVLFDGVCNMCNRFVNLALDIDSVGAVRFAALQSRVGAALLLRSNRAASDYSSIVLCEADGTASVKSSAVLRIASLLPWTPVQVVAALGVLMPSFIRDGAYEIVAANRFAVFGRSDACRLGDDGAFADRFVPDPS